MELNKAVYEKLKQVAKSQDAISYLKLDIDCDLGIDLTNIDGRNKMAEILDTISTHEFRNGRPLLSSVVVYQNIRPIGPGPGYFTMARKLGAWDGKENRHSFHIKALKACHDYWKVH